MPPAEPARLLCDSMLGGLARWLRAMGHDARFEPRIEDAALVARAQQTGEIVLSSDQYLFERRVFAKDHLAGLFVPRHRPIDEQLVFVMRTLGLPVLPPRCMACAGALATLSKDEAAGVVPPRAYDAFHAYFRCTSCGRTFWFGSHWRRIAAKRRAMEEALAGR